LKHFAILRKFQKKENIPMHHETAYKIASDLIRQIPENADTDRWAQNLYEQIILALHHFYPETPDDEPETEKVDIVLDLVFDNILVSTKPERNLIFDDCGTVAFNTDATIFCSKRFDVIEFHSTFVSVIGTCAKHISCSGNTARIIKSGFASICLETLNIFLQDMYSALFTAAGCKTLNFDCPELVRIKDVFLKRISWKDLKFTTPDSTLSVMLFDCKFENCKLGFLNAHVKSGISNNWIKNCEIYSGNFDGFDFADSFGNHFEEGVKGIDIRCPEEGSFVAFKKLAIKQMNAYKEEKFYPGAIAKLLVPEHAKRSTATTNKIRVSEAVVLEITDINTGKEINVAYSLRRAGQFPYRKGDTVKPEYPFDDNRFRECTSGIHCFLTIREAANY